jgi:hypothetical protein
MQVTEAARRPYPRRTQPQGLPCRETGRCAMTVDDLSRSRYDTA